ncbi:MAG: hypothetical protein WD969_07645 [Paracoccaceae bacterium]
MRILLSAIASLALAFPATPVVTKLAVTIVAVAPIVMTLAPTPVEARGGRGGGGRGGGARGGGRGGGGQVRSSGRQNVSNGANRNQNVNRNNNVNRDSNVNRNVNRDIDRSRHVDIDVDHRYGYGGGGAFVAGVATAVAIGAVVSTLPPSCTNYTYTGIAYRNCGGTWYQPQYSGSNVTYIVVDNPG